MKRLTTNDENHILASLNLFYYKDNEVWIRGGGPEPDYADCTLSTAEADRGAARKEVERLKTAMHEKGIIDGLDEGRKHPVWCAACRWSRPEEIDKMWVIHCAKLGIPVWNNFFCAFFEESKA